MAEKEGISIPVVLDDKEYNVQLKKIEKNAESSANKVADSINKAGTIAFKALAVGAAAAVATLTVTLYKSVQAAVEAENGINRLNSILAITGRYSESTSKALQEYAAQLQRTTKFEDDVAISAMGMIASLTKLDQEGIKRATKASADLASALGISLDQAAVMVAKGVNGQVQAFQRLGIAIKDPTNLIGELEKRFGGMSEKMAGTFSGRLEQAKNAFGDLLENLGNLVIKSPTITKVIEYITKQFELVGASIGNIKGDVFNPLLLKLVEIGTTINDYLIKPIEYAYNGFKVFTGFAVMGFLNLGQALAEGLLRPLAMFVRFIDKDAAASIDRFLNESVIAKVGEAQNSVAGFTANAMMNITDTSASEAIAQQLSNLKQVAIDAQSAKVAVNELTNAVVEAEDTSGSITFSGFIKAVQDVNNKVKYTTAQMAQSFNQTLAGGIGNAFQSIGAALVQGENIFEAFGKSMINTLADMLLMFGQMLITIGIGLSAVPMLFGLQGGAAIAAGIAAMVLGGALKAIAGGGGKSSPAQASTGGGVAASSGAEGGITTPETVAVQQEQIERAQPMTNIEVVVEGNILDRRESGLAIADIIKETFDTNGVRFAT